jgi:hypothetical protein
MDRKPGMPPTNICVSSIGSCLLVPVVYLAGLIGESLA